MRAIDKGTIDKGTIIKKKSKEILNGSRFYIYNERLKRVEEYFSS